MTPAVNGIHLPGDAEGAVAVGSGAWVVGLWSCSRGLLRQAWIIAAGPSKNGKHRVSHTNEKGRSIALRTGSESSAFGCAKECASARTPG